MNFPKQATTISEEIALLKKRGLIISDEGLATHFLKFIGYYRLSAYALHYQDAKPQNDPTGLDKHFIEGTTFEDILALYFFDRELRLLVMDAIERIEVAFRSCLVNSMCCKYGPHWYFDRAIFYIPGHHADFIEKVEKELRIDPATKKPKGDHNETFINHYFRKYGDPYLPPAWMICEIMPIGVWSRVYSNLKYGEDRKKIAAHFRVDESVLKEWLHYITYIRNLCAHHSRLWNRRFVIKVSKKHPKDKSADTYFYTAFWIIRHLIEIVAPHTTWALNFAKLIKQYPRVKIGKMGFPENWNVI